MALLEVEEINKYFPGVQALRNVSLSVEAGEVHALVGENGAGKSTLVKIISGAYRPDSGRIIFDGVTFDEFSPAYATAHGISVVHQRQQLVPWLSVEENILLGKQPRRLGVVVDMRTRRRLASELLSQMRLEINPTTPVAQLSPVEQQEVVIAKALYQKARLLILDEPTAALGPAQIERLFELIRELCSQGVSVLYISHHLEEIFQLAQSLTVLRDGVVVTTRPVQELTQGEVVDMMAGHHVTGARDVPADALPPAARRPPEEATSLLELHGLSAGPVLREIDLSVPAGQVLGVTGIVGAGGHDLALTLFGLIEPFAGECQLRGRKYTPHSPRQAIEQGIFLVPENPSRDGLIGLMSVAQNITIVDLPAITHNGILQLKEEVRVARSYVSALHIATPTVEREVRALSGGNQQKVLLAKALQAKAQVFILEEPTQGVDVNAKEEIHRIIRDLAASGKAVLVISTDIRDLLQFTDRMLVLRKGRIVADMPTINGNYTKILNLTLGTEDVSWSQEKA
jgi:ABC-type sugar transport system ATPase subunit